MQALRTATNAGTNDGTDSGSDIGATTADINAGASAVVAAAVAEADVADPAVADAAAVDAANIRRKARRAFATRLSRYSGNSDSGGEHCRSDVDSASQPTIGI